MDLIKLIFKNTKDIKSLERQICCINNEEPVEPEVIRFGVSGEDNTAAENRSFNLGSNHILSFLGTGTSFFTAEIDGTGSSQTSHTVTNGSVQTQAVNSTATSISSISVDPTAIQFGNTTGKYFFANIAEYADNAAALADGLTTGGLYRTGDLLKIVHA